MLWNFWKTPKPDPSQEIIHVAPTPIDPILAEEVARLTELLKQKNQTIVWLQKSLEVVQSNHSKLVEKYTILKEAIELAQTIQFRGKVDEISPGE